MCGFVGFVSTREEKEKIIIEMLEKIRHRGPDSQETYIDDNVALGFARLSIIDLEGGTQPIYNEDKTKVLIFNGEIYNYQDLRGDLINKGHIFTTESDSEVLLHGYEEYGPELLKKLRGMFAFTIWDSQKKELFGARDHFGIKPYYYGIMPDCFFFGSEIKSFLPHPDFKKELNEDCLPNYLSFGNTAGYETFFKGVHKLIPGHYFIYKDGKMDINKYFEAKYEIDHEKTYNEFVDDISNTFKESVKAHQIADVEVGCFLSSGVDSSYVACELAKLQKVKTYTIGFEEKEYSEADNAKMLAEEINVENYERRISGKEYFDNVGKVQYHLDEPLANPSANLLYFVSQRAREDMKVVLSGEGADEIFGGYNIYKDPIHLAKYSKLPKGIRKLTSKVASSFPNFKGKDFLVRGGKTVEERYLGISNVFTEKERNSILKKQYNAQPPQAFTKPFYDKAKDYDDMSKMQYLDLHVWMVHQILLKADKMSMANSLELRVPFLDKQVLTLAETLPTEFKVSEANTKLALRDAARKEINSESAGRRKLAFPLPLPKWLKEDEYYNIVKDAFESNIAKKYFNNEKLLKLLEEHREGKPFRVSKIWTPFTFIVWYKEFFGEKVA